MLTIHASADCDIRLPGAQWLHAFDGRKFSRALTEVRRTHGAMVESYLRPITGPISDLDLRLVHDEAYLASLTNSRTVAAILETWPLRLLPSAFLRQRILHPMRVAAAGTLAAAEAALSHGGVGVCLGGGFHHAHADHGEGFCVYADIPIAIRRLVANGQLTSSDTVLVIDLDAHRGNGFEAICVNEPVQFFDLYNFQVYPGLYEDEHDRLPFVIPLRSGETDAGYQQTLKQELPAFLQRFPKPRLAFFNAGTDVIAGDPIGHLALSEDGVLQRDRLVFDALRQRNIPTVMVTSGGYSRQSYRLIARTLGYLIDRENTVSE